MIGRLGFLWMLISCPALLFAQSYDFSSQLDVQNNAIYHEIIKQHPEKALVEITTGQTGIALDIRYATANNFMHRPMYKQSRAFVRKPVYDALLKVEAQLKPLGLGLKIFDAYRPYTVTVAFYEMAKDTNFVANPKTGSRHNRGCAVDLTLIDLKTGKDLPMPTGFDSFEKQAYSDYTDLSAEVIKNRALLKKVMEKNGFKQLKTEWWHFDFSGLKDYELLDVPFNSL